MFIGIWSYGLKYNNTQTGQLNVPSNIKTIWEGIKTLYLSELIYCK